MKFWLINMLTSLLAFGIAGISGKWLVPFLHRMKFGQPIKTKDGPQWHAGKQGTPTMGGFMFIIASIVSSLCGYWAYRLQADTDLTAVNAFHGFYRLLSVIGFSLLFGLIGFIDDFTKIAKKHNDGLTAMQKIMLQVFFSLGFLYLLSRYGDSSTALDFGFWQTPELGIFYYIILIPVIIYLTNAVNLTDGVDGLCGSVTFTAMLVFTVCCAVLGQRELSCFTMALAGGCLGFLIWNLNPAKCFMGDTGSMFLGAAVTGVGLVLHKHLLLIFVAMVYIIEALSVVIQVSWFKYTKKKYGEGRRIFKMTPIHHHFEMSKWSEYKIVIVFSLVSAAFGIVGIALLLATSY